MPSTELSQYSISNIGPLTTVFTAPSACATATQDLYVGVADDPLPDGKLPVDLWYAKQCDIASLGECYPSGSALDAQYASHESAGDYTGAGTLVYFSPASACPDAHVTVGVAAKNDAGEVSSSGIFVPPVVTDSDYPPMWNPPLNVFMEALDKNETAVICCPAEYTAGVNGGCYSQVPWSEYGETTACMRTADGDFDWYTRANATFTYNNTVVTNEVMSFTATRAPPIGTSTTTLDDYVVSSMTPFKAANAVTLVYNTAAPAETAPSAAQGGRMTTSGGGAGILVMAWGLAGLVGIALAVPW